MATIGTFNAWTNIFLQCLRKNKDFDTILFEYLMLLNIQKEYFFDILRKYINKFYQDEKLSYLSLSLSLSLSL